MRNPVIRGHFLKTVSYLPHVKEPVTKGHRSCRDTFSRILRCPLKTGQPRWLSGLRRSRVHSLCPLAVIARRSLCPEKLGSNPGQGSKGINFSGLAWSRYVRYCDKETLNSQQTLEDRLYCRRILCRINMAHILKS